MAKLKIESMFECLSETHLRRYKVNILSQFFVYHGQWLLILGGWMWGLPSQLQRWRIHCWSMVLLLQWFPLETAWIKGKPFGCSKQNSCFESVSKRVNEKSIWYSSWNSERDRNTCGRRSNKFLLLRTQNKRRKQVRDEFISKAHSTNKKWQDAS